MKFGASSEKLDGILACSVQVVSLDDVLVVREFPDVFPDEFSGMPLVRDLEFVINPVPGTSPISKKTLSAAC